MDVPNPEVFLAEALRAGELFTLPGIGTFVRAQVPADDLTGGGTRLVVRLEKGEYKLPELYQYIQTKYGLGEATAENTGRMIAHVLRRNLSEQGSVVLPEVGKLVLEGENVLFVQGATPAPAPAAGAAPAAPAAPQPAPTPPPPPPAQSAATPPATTAPTEAAPAAVPPSAAPATPAVDNTPPAPTPTPPPDPPSTTPPPQAASPTAGSSSSSPSQPDPANPSVMRTADGRAIIPPRVKKPTTDATTPSRNSSPSSASAASVGSGARAAARPPSGAGATRASGAAPEPRKPKVAEASPEAVLRSARERLAALEAEEERPKQTIEFEEPKRKGFDLGMFLGSIVIVLLVGSATVVLVYRKQFLSRINNETGWSNAEAIASAAADSAAARTPAPATDSNVPAPASPAPARANEQPAQPAAVPPAAAAPAPTEARRRPAAVRPAKGPWRLLVGSWLSEDEGRAMLRQWQARDGWDPRLEQWPDGRWRLSILTGATSASIRARLEDAKDAGAPADAYARKWPD